MNIGDGFEIPTLDDQQNLPQADRLMHTSTSHPVLEYILEWMLPFHLLKRIHHMSGYAIFSKNLPDLNGSEQIRQARKEEPGIGWT